MHFLRILFSSLAFLCPFVIGHLIDFLGKLTWVFRAGFLAFCVFTSMFDWFGFALSFVLHYPNENHLYYMASSVSAQNEPNLAKWLANRAGKIARAIKHARNYPLCAIYLVKIWLDIFTPRLVNNLFVRFGFTLSFGNLIQRILALSFDWLHISLYCYSQEVVLRRRIPERAREPDKEKT